MWKRFVSWPRGTRLATWSATNPLKAMGAVCLAFAAVGLALGALAPWQFLKNASTDFVGGVLAGLLIFGLANIAFGFTERREKERHALRMAYRMLLLEMLDNHLELSRTVKALRGGSLTRNYPVFGPSGRLKAENWQLLAQGPLIEHLSPDLFLAISISYRVSRSFVNNLRNDGLALGAANRQAWKDFCKRHVAGAENAIGLVSSAQDELRIAHESMKGS